MADGTLKDLSFSGNIDVDKVIDEIRSKGQSRNFMIKTISSGGSLPGANDGEVGNIWIVDDSANSGNWYIMAKCSSTTWRKTIIT